MAVHYWDTSALVKRYVQETGTAWVQGLTASGSGHTHFLARITLVETIAAVIRRERTGGLTPADAAVAIADFEDDFAKRYRIIEITAGLIAQAARLTLRLGLRAYDAVQLAAAVELHRLDPGLILGFRRSRFERGGISRRANG